MAETWGRIAGYELLGLLGQGRSGAVHLARPPARLGIGVDPVCVKVLAGRHPHDRFVRATERLATFARVAARGGSYLVHLYEMGRTGETVWFSMAHHSLGSLVDPAVPLARDDRIRAVAAAARGVHALHEAGTAHGDIKPTNVLLSAEGPKLADMELAPCLNPALTLYATSLLADVEFTDPAAIRGEPLTPASDIWSLGMTLHRVLAGEPVHPPGPEDDMLSTIRRIGTTKPEISASLSVAEAHLVRACLAADAGDRPATAAVLATAIEELL